MDKAFAKSTILSSIIAGIGLGVLSAATGGLGLLAPAAIGVGMLGSAVGGAATGAIYGVFTSLADAVLHRKKSLAGDDNSHFFKRNVIGGAVAASVVGVLMVGLCAASGAAVAAVAGVSGPAVIGILALLGATNGAITGIVGKLLHLSPKDSHKTPQNQQIAETAKLGRQVQQEADMDTPPLSPGRTPAMVRSGSGPSLRN